MCLVLLAVAGCATQPVVSGSCAVGSPAPSVLVEAETRQGELGCGSSVADTRSVSTIAAVSQTRGQTRTVGVPREFLVALIILILLIGLA